MTKLSIITINYDNVIGLRRTLDSVSSQSCKFFEHIVVDGGSTDGSRDVLQAYNKSTLGYSINWVSEPDSGIFNAMNKGIQMSQGEYLLFLNSGDVLDNVDVVSYFIKTPLTVDVATGFERMPNGKLITPPKEEQLTYAFFYEDTLLHQSTFIRRDAFDRFGRYREDYRIVSDWEWFFRVIIREDASYQTLDFVVSSFDGGGISNNPEYYSLQNQERDQVHEEILPRVRLDYLELINRRLSSIEFQHLKNGKFGWLVNFLLHIKAMKSNR